MGCAKPCSLPLSNGVRDVSWSLGQSSGMLTTLSFDNGSVIVSFHPHGHISAHNNTLYFWRMVLLPSPATIGTTYSWGVR